MKTSLELELFLDALIESGWAPAVVNLRTELERIVKAEIESAFRAGWDAHAFKVQHDLEMESDPALAMYLAGTESRWDFEQIEVPAEIVDHESDCPHPARQGRHEWYLSDQWLVCRACGAHANATV